MTTATPETDFDHGDPKRYRRGCRCPKCTKAVVAESRKNRYMRQTGRGTQTSPHRAAQHIEHLRAACLADADIQRAASISPDVCYRVLRREGTIFRTTERRILAIPIPATPIGKPTATTSSLGTRRRLQALAADGWPGAELARRSDRKKQYIIYLQADQSSDKIRMWVARDIRNLYTDLRDQRPEDAGVAPQRARLTRQRAAAKNWLGTAYWDDDDFDNPDFAPAATDLPKYMRLGEDALWLREQGYTSKQIAHRLGESQDYISQSVKRYQATGASRGAAA